VMHAYIEDWAGLQEMCEWCCREQSAVHLLLLCTTGCSISRCGWLLKGGVHQSNSACPTGA